MRWKSDRARADEVRQAHVYWKDHCTRALDNRPKSTVACLCGCSTHRNGISRIFHHTILRMSSSNTKAGVWNPCKRRVGIVQPCGSRLTPSPCGIILPVPLGLDPQEDDANSLAFLGVLTHRAGRPSKNVSRSSHRILGTIRQSRIAADHPSGTRNTHGLTGNVRHSRAGRSFRIINSPASFKELTLCCSS